MKSVLVIDDFYKNPAAVRELALSADYLQSEQLPAGYPGTESKNMFYSQDLVNHLSRLLGEKVLANPKQASFGVFSKPIKGSEFRPKVHVDATAWTGIVYLNETFDPDGGTELVEHVETGRVALPDEEFKEVMRRDQFHAEAWKVHTRVASRFNRLLLFRSGLMFHRASPKVLIGGELRLTQLFFFNTAAG